ncbi:MAG TPA: hypothetical protein VKB36_15370, partial [Vicinamibacterales bacterium]|nr:hypothetical protein [Vicinamibacterales bacterium]
ITTVMITNSVEEALLLSDRILPMTSGPRARLGTPVAVELARPRSASDLLHDDHAADVRAHVVASLTEDLRRARAHRVVSGAGLLGAGQACEEGGPEGPHYNALQVVPEIEG